MSCFGGTPVALKEEYLKNTPFFLLAAETDDATILPELAKYATVKKFNAASKATRSRRMPSGTPRKSTAAKWAWRRARRRWSSRSQSVCQVFGRRRGGGADRGRRRRACAPEFRVPRALELAGR